MFTSTAHEIVGKHVVRRVLSRAHPPGDLLLPLPGNSGCRKTLLRKGLAEFRRPQTTEGKEAPSFSATCASEMTPLMTDRATFLQESSPVRHASLCRKRPKAFFDRLNSPRLCRGLFACLSKNVYQMSTIGTFKPEKPTFFVLTYHSPYKFGVQGESYFSVNICKSSVAFPPPKFRRRNSR